MKRIAPEGWLCEPEDRSVGIFGDAWYHDACPVETDDPSEAEVIEDAVVTPAGVTLAYTTTLKCPDCGATVTMNEAAY